MSDDEFRALVARMRHVQRDYFRTRDRALVAQAKELEKKVDDELEAAREGQRKLF